MACRLVMYAAHAVAGYPGVVALAALTITLFAGLVVASCRRVAHPMIACVVLALVSLAALPSLAPRPQLISWVLLAAVCPYMRRSVGVRRLPWGLLPTIWVWANLHGLWLIALVLFGFLVLGLIIEEGRHGWRTSARFCGFGLVALAAAAVTPSGPRLLLAPLHVREYAKFVLGVDAAEHHHSGCRVCAGARTRGSRWMGSTGPAGTCRDHQARRRGDSRRIACGRTVPILAIAVAPLAAATAQRWLGDEPTRFRCDARESLTWVVVVLLAMPLIALQLFNVSNIAPGKHLNTTTATVLSATESLEGLPGRARVLNDYALGGWLLWAARDTSPAIDGRADVYSVHYVQKYVDALAMRPAGSASCPTSTSTQRSSGAKRP